MPQRSPRWIWAGRGVFAAIAVALVVYLSTVELNTADMVASCVSAVVALAALTAPYLLPARTGGGAARTEPDRAEETGEGPATGGGQANSGVWTHGGDRPARASRTGPATAHGPGSIANSGVLHQRDDRQ